MHLFRGRVIREDELDFYLDLLEETMNRDLALKPLKTSIVINAFVTLMNQLDYEGLKTECITMGLSEWKAEELIETVRSSITKEELQKKVDRELGSTFNEWIKVEDGIMEKRQALGVLAHIGAGNVVALSVLSVMEGLLSGNINLLKLPSYEGGISMRILTLLVEIEPLLEPYIYVFDIPSSDTVHLEKISKVADAIIVWGSDEAILGLRQITPPTIRLIEWGHRISFAYFTLDHNYEEDLIGLAEEICVSNQLNCSSPQTVFVEAEDLQVVKIFAKELLEVLEKKAKSYPMNPLSLGEQGEITWTKENVKMEEILGNQFLFESKDKNLSVMLQMDSELKVSPKYRNIWITAIQRDNIIKLLRRHSGHLQTVGLACHDKDLIALRTLFYQGGVQRVTTCGNMSKTYVGEPHDGRVTLKEYTRVVSFR